MKLWRRSSNRKWRRGAISGLRRKCHNFVIFRPIWPKFGPKLDLRMGHRDAMSPERYGAVRGAAAPFPAAPPSKWRPFNNSVIFQPICFKFEYKVDRRMGNDVAMPPQRRRTWRRSAISGGATLKMAFLVALHSHPFYNSITVIFWANLKGRSYDEVLCNTTAIKLFLVKRPSK